MLMPPRKRKCQTNNFVSGELLVIRNVRRRQNLQGPLPIGKDAAC